MADIFLSYSSGDRLRARKLADLFEDAGWTVWMDRFISGGMEWNPELMSELGQARVVVVLWTRDSIESEWVQTEARAARERGVLLPVLLHPVTPPGDLAEVQCTPVTAWIDESNTYELQPLLDRVSEFLGVEAPALPGAKLASTNMQITRTEIVEAVFRFCSARLTFFHERRSGSGAPQESLDALAATYKELARILDPVSSDELHELINKHADAYTPRDEHEA